MLVSTAIDAGRVLAGFRGGDAGTDCGGSGGEENNRNELSDWRGAFQGNRLKVMQQKMIASDHISAGCGSYFNSLQTSGARYGSDPTIP
jgi:hypothetical protein